MAADAGLRTHGARRGRGRQQGRVSLRVGRLVGWDQPAGLAERLADRSRFHGRGCRRQAASAASTASTASTKRSLELRGAQVHARADGQRLPSDACSGIAAARGRESVGVILSAQQQPLISEGGKLEHSDRVGQSQPLQLYVHLGRMMDDGVQCMH